MIRRLIYLFRRDRSDDAVGIDDAELEDLLQETFEDYQQSITDLLDANPERSAELIRGLEEATEKWERRRFEAITRPLGRDRTLRRLDRQLNRQT